MLLFHSTFLVLFGAGLLLAVLVPDPKPGFRGAPNETNPFGAREDAGLERCSTRYREASAEARLSKNEEEEDRWHPLLLQNHTTNRRNGPRLATFEQLTPTTWRIRPAQTSITSIEELLLKRRARQGRRRPLSSSLLEGRISVFKNAEAFVVEQQWSSSSSCEPDGDCFSFLGYDNTRVRWRHSPAYSFGSLENPFSFSRTRVKSSFRSSVNAWNEACGCEVWTHDKTHDDASALVHLDSPNGVNLVTFEDLHSADVWAVTVTWGVFSGSAEERELIEADLILNTRPDSSVFPLDCVMLHEAGHMFGEGDVYREECSHVTMYGYISPSALCPSFLLSMEDEASVRWLGNACTIS